MESLSSFAAFVRRPGILSLALVVLTLFAASHLTAQDEVVFNQGAEDRFLLGLHQYTSGEYQAAYLSFLSTREDFPMNQRTTGAVIMAGKSLFRIGEYREAAASAEDFLFSFPHSLYRMDARYTLGAAKYALRDYVGSVRQMLIVLDSASEGRTLSRARLIFESAATDFLSLEDVNGLLAEYPAGLSHKLLVLYKAEKEYDFSEYVEARNDANAVLGLSPYPYSDERARLLISRIDHGASVTIGALLPLMRQVEAPSGLKKLAADLYDGMKFAVDQYNASLPSGGLDVNFDAHDTRRDSATSVQAIQSWLDDKNCLAVVGPIFSNVVAAVAPLANDHGLPLITPTATDSGLAAIGPYIFQANADVVVRGKAMAQYAILQRGFHRLGVVASDMPQTKAMADAFVSEAIRLGAVVISDKRYIRGTADLRFLFRAMRAEAAEAGASDDLILGADSARTVRRLLDLGIRRGLIDSIGARGGEFGVDAIFGPNGRHVADSLGFPVARVVVDVDSMQYPVKGIEAVYCPIASSSEIGVITAQLAYFNIATQELGSDEWNDLNELETNKRYADGVIFTADRWSEPTAEYDRIAARFQQVTTRRLDENVLFGYDAMSLLLSLIRKGGTTRDHLADMLATVDNYPGLHANITLTEGRVNSCLHILEYTRGKITRIGEVQYRKDALPGP